LFFQANKTKQGDRKMKKMKVTGVLTLLLVTCLFVGCPNSGTPTETTTKTAGDPTLAFYDHNGTLRVATNLNDYPTGLFYGSYPSEENIADIYIEYYYLTGPPWSGTENIMEDPSFADVELEDYQSTVRFGIYATDSSQNRYYADMSKWGATYNGDSIPIVNNAWQFSMETDPTIAFYTAGDTLRVATNLNSYPTGLFYGSYPTMVNIEDLVIEYYYVDYGPPWSGTETVMTGSNTPFTDVELQDYQGTVRFAVYVTDSSQTKYYADMSKWVATYNDSAMPVVNSVWQFSTTGEIPGSEPSTFAITMVDGSMTVDVEMPNYIDGGTFTGLGYSDVAEVGVEYYYSVSPWSAVEIFSGVDANGNMPLSFTSGMVDFIAPTIRFGIVAKNSSGTKYYAPQTSLWDVTLNGSDISLVDDGNGNYAYQFTMNDSPAKLLVDGDRTEGFKLSFTPGDKLPSDVFDTIPSGGTVFSTWSDMAEIGVQYDGTSTEETIEFDGRWPIVMSLSDYPSSGDIDISIIAYDTSDTKYQGIIE
jgi:hypothetical protein